MSADFQKQEEILSQILQQHRAKDYRLPPFVAEKTWLDRLWTYLDDKLGELLHRVFPQLDLSSMTHPLQMILMVGMAIAVLIAAIFLFAAVYKRLRRRPPAFADHLKEALQFQGGQQYLIDQIKEALRGGFFSKAARLRWKLFLERCQFPKCTTPRECLAMGRMKTAVPDGEVAALVDLKYRMMFGSEASTRQDFEKIDLKLRVLEGGIGGYA